MWDLTTPAKAIVHGMIRDASISTSLELKYQDKTSDFKVGADIGANLQQVFDDSRIVGIVMSFNIGIYID